MVSPLFLIFYWGLNGVLWYIPQPIPSCFLEEAYSLISVAVVRFCLLNAVEIFFRQRLGSGNESSSESCNVSSPVNLFVACSPIDLVYGFGSL